MDQQARVEIVPRMVAADDSTKVRRAETVQRLAELGQVDNPGAGSVGDTMQDGWLVRINGVEVPAVAYSVASPDQGAGPVLVSLAVEASSVSIGDPSAVIPAPKLRPPVPHRSGWNTPPSETLAAQVAHNAEVSA